MNRIIRSRLLLRRAKSFLVPDYENSSTFDNFVINIWSFYNKYLVDFR